MRNNRTENNNNNYREPKSHTKRERVKIGKEFDYAKNEWLNNNENNMKCDRWMRWSKIYQTQKNTIFFLNFLRLFYLFNVNSR